MKQFFYFEKKNIGKDVIAGIIVALLSIPISMGYAQIAGLPAVYGLYGSLLPILVFGLISSSRQFAVGVDAMPAVMVGSMLSTLGITAGSEEALQLVPMVSLLVGVWFLLFYLLKAGRVVKYISNPVMGGFISGVGLTIILMQIPKMLGGTAGTGELHKLVIHMVEQRDSYNIVSASLGICTVLILQVWKKYYPKFPMPIFMMIIGAFMTIYLPLEEKGVKLLPEVASGLPKVVVPAFALLFDHMQEILVESLLIALVVMAQTLLASNAYAQKYRYTLNTRRELMGYSAMNVASALVGCCPINGSVSRSGVADQYGCKSQIMSFSAAITMLLVLLFGTPLLKYLPVPVLTGIVMSALIGILDIKQAKRLWKVNRKEFFIFLIAMVGVLLFGTINGVVLGMALSFFAVIVRAVIPPKSYLGQIPGHEDDFYNLQRNKSARPIAGTLIYRFSGNLFFANIGTFEEDILKGIRSDTTVVIVDARGIANIDITAADRLLLLQERLAEQGIRFYLTEHVGSVNDQLRSFGAGDLIKRGCVRRTITLALRDAGIERPYPLVGEMVDVATPDEKYHEAGERLAEFEWAFGDNAEEEMELIAEQVVAHMLDENVAENSVDEYVSISLKQHGIEKLNPEENARYKASVSDYLQERDMSILQEAEQLSSFGRIGLFDEDELLDYLEIRIEEMSHLSPQRKERLCKLIEKRRLLIESKLQHLSPHAGEMLHAHRRKLAEHLRENHPEEYQKILEWEEKHGGTQV